jgi:thioredoxin 1
MGAVLDTSADEPGNFRRGIPGHPRRSVMASSQNVLELDDNNFGDVVSASSVPVLVDFTAAWCGPCRAIAPHIAAVADKYVDRVRVAKCDVDANQGLTARFDVRAMPTLLMFKDGKVVGQIVGAVPRHKIESLVEGVLPV